MDVYEVVDQVVHPLRQRGWLTYRSLKLQFKLDDDTLEAVGDLNRAEAFAEQSLAALPGSGRVPHRS
jgi:hypothetical protein